MLLLIAIAAGGRGCVGVRIRDTAAPGTLRAMATTPPPPPTTAAYFAQAVISFAVALLAVALAIVYLPADPWVRAFLAVSVLYVVTSAFTLAKCVRDRQESTAVVSRVDQARLDKLLAEHDPFKVDA